jgi:hypothetical protein
VLGLYRTQIADTLWYNSYYVISEDACQAIFVQDKNDDEIIDSPPVDSIYTGFHRYARGSGYDQNSECEGQYYNPNGCGNAPGSFLAGIGDAETMQAVAAMNIQVYPNPVVNDLTIRFGVQKESALQIQMVDLSGRIVLQKQQQFTKGSHQLSIKDLKAQGVKPGIYMMAITTNEERKLVKLLVQ